MLICFLCFGQWVSPSLWSLGALQNPVWVWSPVSFGSARRRAYVYRCNFSTCCCLIISRWRSNVIPPGLRLSRFLPDVQIGRTNGARPPLTLRCPAQGVDGRDPFGDTRSQPRVLRCPSPWRRGHTGRDGSWPLAGFPPTVSAVSDARLLWWQSILWGVRTDVKHCWLNLNEVCKQQCVD